MSLATPIHLERLCRLALVSRAGFYRWRDASEAVDRDLDLRDEIQRVALEFPYYGWPRITRELGESARTARGHAADRNASTCQCPSHRCSPLVC